MPSHAGPSAHCFILAQEPLKHYSPGQRAAVKQWAIWTGGLILGALLITGITLVILDRHRRTVLRTSTRKRKKSRPPPDAWSESAKRIDPAAIAAGDDTVDIDPDELGPGDIDEGPDPHGEGGPRRGSPR